MTGDDNPQAQQGYGGGFPGGGFGFGDFGGINIEDLMRQGFFHQGHPGGQQGRGGQGKRQRGHTTYTFSFGGGDGIRFEF